MEAHPPRLRREADPPRLGHVLPVISLLRVIQADTDAAIARAVATIGAELRFLPEGLAVPGPGRSGIAHPAGGSCATLRYPVPTVCAGRSAVGTDPAA